MLARQACFWAVVWTLPVPRIAAAHQHNQKGMAKHIKTFFAVAPKGMKLIPNSSTLIQPTPCSDQATQALMDGLLCCCEAWTSAPPWYPAVLAIWICCLVLSLRVPPCRVFFAINQSITTSGCLYGSNGCLYKELETKFQDQRNFMHRDLHKHIYPQMRAWVL